MKTRKCLLLALLALMLYCVAGFAMPNPPIYYEVDGQIITTQGDEFGSITKDDQGKVVIQENDQWFYAKIDSSTTPHRLSKYSLISQGIPDELAAYQDPMIQAQRDEFDSHATEIIPVSGAIRATIIHVWFAYGPPEDEPDIANFWDFEHNSVIHQLDPQKYYDVVFLDDYLGTYPADTSVIGDDIAGSANDWWQWSSHGTSWLEPDVTRHPSADNPTHPGLIVDPETGGPFVIMNSYTSMTSFWETLEAAGIDMNLDPMRPIILMGYPGNSHAHYGGWTFLNLRYGLSPMMTGVIVHELGHCVLQLPDLYNDHINSWQVMSHGCLGFHHPEYGRNHSFASDICPTYKTLIGWEAPITINDPGDFYIDTNNPRQPHVIANPLHQEEDLVLYSWDTSPESFTRRHVPENDGRILIEHAGIENDSWRFQDKPYPPMIWSDSTNYYLTWPSEVHSHLPMELWDRDDLWFSWSIDCSVDGGNASFSVAERPAPEVYVTLTEESLLKEVPLGGADVDLTFLNLGSEFSDWQITIGDETVSGSGPIGFNETFQASFSADVWGAYALGQVLDLPIQLNTTSPPAELIIDHLQPFVGLVPAGLQIDVNSQVIVESFQQYLAIAEGDEVSLYTDGQLSGSLSWGAEIKRMCFVDSPLLTESELIVLGEDWAVMCRVEGIFAQESGWPVSFPTTIDAYMIADTPENDASLIIVAGEELICYSIDEPTDIPTYQDLPDFILPVTSMAWAADDPAGDLGSRFCFAGGHLNHQLFTMSFYGDSLSAGNADENERVVRAPLAVDLHGNGYYEFIAPRLFADAYFDIQEELWMVSYSQEQGHHGTGVLDMGMRSLSMDNGVEALIPFRNTDYPSRSAVFGNDYYPYSDYMTDLKLIDLGHNSPEVRIVHAVPPRRRWLNVGDFNGNGMHDILMVDRGDGVHLLRGTGDLNFSAWHSNGPKVHHYTEMNFRPVFWQVNGETLLGCWENGHLTFYQLPTNEWPVWTRDAGPGNRRFMPNQAWTPPSASLNPPDVTISSTRSLDMRLNIESLTVGQVATSYQVWASTDLEQWELLDEVPWDGQINDTWVHHRALQQSSKLFYRVVSVNEPVDGNVFWTE